MKVGQIVLNPRTGEKSRVTRLMQAKANHLQECEKVFSGDIAVVAGLVNIKTGDTLCSFNFPICLDALSFPKPVVSMAVEPRSCTERYKLVQALEELSYEDPTFAIRIDAETGQTIISGMGELHLEIIKDRLFQDFKIEANVGKPQVAYRESIGKCAEADIKFTRQVAGCRQYAHLVLKVKPMPSGYGITIDNQLPGVAVPKEYHQALEEAIHRACDCGVIAGYPLIDLHIIVFDGSYHQSDSSGLAFEIVASMAIREVIQKAEPLLMEPVMRLEVTVPQENIGDVIGDLSSRRGQVVEIDAEARTSRVIAQVPLSELFGYATVLRSLTKGRAVFVAEPLKFVKVSVKLQNKLIKV